MKWREAQGLVEYDEYLHQRDQEWSQRERARMRASRSSLDRFDVALFDSAEQRPTSTIQAEE